MTKFSALFLAVVAVALSVSQAIRFLNCKSGNEGHIFVRSGLSVYKCTNDRREVFVGCLYSKHPTSSSIYGFTPADIEEYFASESVNSSIYSVGKKKTPNCCYLSTMTEEGNRNKGVQYTIRQLVMRSNGEEVPFDTREDINSIVALSDQTARSAFPLNGICQADTTKKVFTNHDSKLYKCSGDTLVHEDVCAFNINGTAAIRCEKKATVDNVIRALEFEFDDILTTDADYCCKINKRIIEKSDLIPHLKPCNDF